MRGVAKSIGGTPVSHREGGGEGRLLSMLIDLVSRSAGRPERRNLLKFIARKIGEKEFTFWECARPFAGEDRG